MFSEDHQAALALQLVHNGLFIVSSCIWLKENFNRSSSSDGS